jgi:hypothetical protein
MKKWSGPPLVTGLGGRGDSHRHLVRFIEREMERTEKKQRERRK